MKDVTRPELFLTKHTFVAFTDETLVFLNLRDDRYACLERKYITAFAALFGLSEVTEALERGNIAPLIAPSAETAAEVKNMIDSGYATRDFAEGKIAQFVRQHDELREMLGFLPGESPKLRTHHVFNFLLAFIKTKYLLRFATMESRVTRVKRRRDRFYAKGGIEAPYNEINELVEIYKILKPLFITVKDECVFNSLFLIEFLASYRVYPSWYFGVRLHEFYAHCWVQDRNIIFDDFIKNTSSNTPIMAV